MQLTGCIPGRDGLWTIDIRGERIASVRPATAREPGRQSTHAASGILLTPPGDSAPDAFPWISPGFIDLQVNGFGGYDFNGPDRTPADAAGAIRALWATGTCHVLATVVTAPPEAMRQALRAIALAKAEPGPVSDSLLGIHLEGPFISDEDGPRGAHPPEHVRMPDWDEFCRLQEAADGHIRMITLAPERPGALPFIERAVAAGVVVAIGHTAASSAEIAAAVAAGARISTHLGNGAHARINRHPNYIWDQLAADELWASLIADGHHLPPAVLRTMIRAKGVPRTVLVSDAVALAGLPPGTYGLFGRAVELTGSGCIRLPGTPYLAGSALRLPDGVANVMRWAGIPLSDAAAMVTRNPAQVLGLEPELGSLRAGMPASLTVFRTADGRIDVDMTVIRGRVAYVRPSRSGPHREIPLTE